MNDGEAGRRAVQIPAVWPGLLLILAVMLIHRTHVSAGVSPHGGEFIYAATGTKTCADCHGATTGEQGGVKVLDNEAVRRLKAKAPGVHGPGRFADCFRCHPGGNLDRGAYPRK